jgi:hypothetical protein
MYTSYDGDYLYAYDLKLIYLNADECAKYFHLQLSYGALLTNKLRKLENYLDSDYAIEYDEIVNHDFYRLK